MLNAFSPLRSLTPRQKEALDLIVAYHRSHGYMPSWSEIKTGLNTSQGSVSQLIDALVSKGYLKRTGEGRTARNLRLLASEGGEVTFGETHFKALPEFAQDYIKTLEVELRAVKQTLEELGNPTPHLTESTQRHVFRADRTDLEDDPVEYHVRLEERAKTPTHILGRLYIWGESGRALRITPHTLNSVFIDIFPREDD